MSLDLAVRDLHLAFHGVAVLRGVDLDVGAGRITGLIGPNGAGKSTLFNAVTGLYASRGSIRLGGREAAGMRPDQRVEAGLVRTFQLARGFPKLSVHQHLMVYGQRQPGEALGAAVTASRHGRDHEAALAERALAIARRLRLDHVLDNPVTALSGGQKKLLEIGRALMAEPKLLLLDEPMAGVNPSLVDEIAGHLKAIHAEGVSILLIEHDMALIRRLCDPVIVMADGRTLTQGHFDEVAADVRVQEAYLGSRKSAGTA